MQAHVARRLQTKRRGFVTSFRHRVYARDKRRPPLLILGSSIPWVGLHERGGSIAGRMLIPFGPHIGRQRFRQIIDALMRAGNAWFQRSPNGRVFLFAENIPENAKPLARFKRAHRQRHQLKSLKRGATIPIAELVSRVQLRRRLDVVALVRARLPLIQNAIIQAASRRL